MMRETRLLQVNPTQPEAEAIREAAEVIRRGGLVAFPTETVYGLGANATDEQAVAGIFAAKQRPANDPIIVHIAGLNALTEVARDIPPLAYILAESFWPGPLTLVLRRGERIPANISAGMDTVAVRMPRHPVALALIEAAGLPIGAPSANTFSRPSATTAQHVLDDLNGRIDLILDGGPATIGIESTVIDLTGTAPLILRPGGIPPEALEALVPGIIIQPRYLNDTVAAPAPGQAIKHYSPHARLILFDGDRDRVVAHMVSYARQLRERGERAGVLAADEDAPFFEAASVELALLGSQTDLLQIGANLFAAMRSLDRSGVDVILARGFGQRGLGAAIWDRLLRAAEGQVIHVK